MTGNATTKPHVLFVANRILGWNTYSQQLAKQLAERENITSSILWRRPHPISTLLVKRHDVTSNARLYRHIDPITAYRIWLGRTIRREIRATAPDLVHFGAHWPAAAYAWQGGAVPFTVAPDCTMHDMNRDLPRPVWTDREILAESELFRRAAKVYPMSGWTARSVIDEAGVHVDKVRIIPPSIDLTAFHPPQPHAGVPNVVFVGNDFVRKGGDRLLSWVTGPLAGLCHLHILSGDPMANVQRPGVTWHGKVTHAVLFGELLPQMDLICLPTRLDMSPHVLVEAAAAGVPAVASDVGGISDIVLDQRTGVLVSSGDDQAFIAALRRLIEDSALRARMQTAAIRHAKTFDASVNFGMLADELATLALNCAQNRLAGAA